MSSYADEFPTTFADGKGLIIHCSGCGKFVKFMHDTPAHTAEFKRRGTICDTCWFGAKV